MLYPLLAAALAAVLAVWLAPKILPRRAVIALGIAIAVIGAATVAYVEWRYAPANTLVVQMPVALDRAGKLRTPPFHVAVSGPYDIWLEFDRKQEGGEDFACLTGDPGAEAVCPRKDPDLDVFWSVDGPVMIAYGLTDWKHWHAVQAALDPAEAARRRKAYDAYQARSLDPSNNWPLYYRLGSFVVVAAGGPYFANLVVKKPAGALAALHPRLAIGLSSRATKGLGTMALLFCLLCAVTGGALLLRTIPRGHAA